MPARAPSPADAVVQHGFVTLEHRRCHYYRWGSTGPPVVLVHGTGFHGYVWKPIAEALSRDYRVLAYDQRGHGDSYKPDGGYRWEVFGDDLFDVLEPLQ